jgi:hypothetical protein
LVEAVYGGFEGAVIGLRDMQNQMEDGFAGLERTAPVTFKREGGPLCRLLWNGWRLGDGHGTNGCSEN